MHWYKKYSNINRFFYLKIYESISSIYVTRKNEIWQCDTPVNVKKILNLLLDLQGYRRCNCKKKCSTNKCSVQGMVFCAITFIA